MKKYFLLLLLLVILVGCSSKSNDTISYLEAKEKIINNGAILVDVRSQEEYDEGHIEGATLLTLDTIESNVGNVINDKNTEIIVYCKSGVRSHQAYELLTSLGYKNVYDFGSIDNWKE